MSTAPLVRDPSTKRLLDDGYDLVVDGNHLIVRGIPYVTAEGAVAYGSLACPITVSGDVIIDGSGDHRIWFIGSQPHDERGTPVPGVSADRRAISSRLTASFMISNKPPEGYPDSYEKVTSYVRILFHPARAVDPTVTATPGANWDAPEDGLPFVYRDTATSRAGLAALNEMFRGQRIAIVGLGGTGSYILDQIAKTWVESIALIDGDHQDNHNAFRSPGATSIEDLRRRPNKADYYAELYSRMHTGITAYPMYLDEQSLSLLEDATFVFLAAADGDALPMIKASLSQRAIPFIDVGMGIEETDGHLAGLLRVSNHIPGHAQPQVRETTGGPGDDYDRNIQTADLNALNAVLAVIAWKKHLGYYAQHTHAVETYYKTFTGDIRSEDGQ